MNGSGDFRIFSDTVLTLMTVSYTHLDVYKRQLLFHVCSRFQVPAFLGSSFAFLGGFSTVANLNTGMYATMSVNDKAAYACGGAVSYTHLL